MSDFVLLSYFFDFTLSSFEIRKTIFNNEIQDTRSSSCDFVCFATAPGLGWLPSESLGTKVKAPENHRKKQMAGADPEQSHYSGLGAGRDADTGSVPNLTGKT